MRDRFSDLIKKGVAAFQEKPVGTAVPCLDPMVKTYNNLWGLLTDTHMSAVEDGYIITGTFVKSQYWEGFKYCCYYGNTNIKLGSGYSSLENMVYANGYEMKPDSYNGDYVIKLTKRPEPAVAPGAENVACDCAIPCAGCCPCAYTTSESEIPHPLKEAFTPDQEKALRQAWSAAGGDAVKVIENLKESYDVDSSKFRISADNQYMIVDERLKIKLQ